MSLPSVQDFLDRVSSLPYPHRIREAAVLGKGHRHNVAQLKAFVGELLRVERPPNDFGPLKGQQTNIARHYDRHQLGLFAAAAGGLVDVLLEYFKQVPSTLLKPLVLSELMKQASNDVLQSLIVESERSAQLKLVHSAIQRSKFDLVDFAVKHCSFSREELIRIIHGCSTDVVNKYIDGLWPDLPLIATDEEKRFLLKIMKHHPPTFFRKLRQTLANTEPSKRGPVWNWVSSICNRELAPFADYILQACEEYPWEQNVQLKDRTWTVVTAPPSVFLSTAQTVLYRRNTDRWLAIVLSGLEGDLKYNFDGEVISRFPQPVMEALTLSMSQYASILKRVIPDWENVFPNGKKSYERQPSKQLGLRVGCLLSRVKLSDLNEAIRFTKEWCLKVSNNKSPAQLSELYYLFIREMRLRGYKSEKQKGRVPEKQEMDPEMGYLWDSPDEDEKPSFTFEVDNKVFDTLWTGFIEDALENLSVDALVKGTDIVHWPFERRVEMVRILKSAPNWRGDKLLALCINHFQFVNDVLESDDAIAAGVTLASFETLVRTKKVWRASGTLVRSLAFVPLSERLPIIDHLRSEGDEEIKERLLSYMDPSDVEYLKQIRNTLKNHKCSDTRTKSWKHWIEAAFHAESPEMVKTVLKELIEGTKNETPASKGDIFFSFHDKQFFARFYQRHGLEDSHIQLWKQFYNVLLDSAEDCWGLDERLRSFAQAFCKHSVDHDTVHIKMFEFGRTLDIMIWKKSHMHEKYEITFPDTSNLHDIAQWKELVAAWYAAAEAARTPEDQEQDEEYDQVDDMTAPEPILLSILDKVVDGLKNGDWIEIGTLKGFAAEQLDILQTAEATGRRFTERHLLDVDPTQRQDVKWAYMALSKAFRCYCNHAFKSTKRRSGRVMTPFAQIRSKRRANKPKKSEAVDYRPPNEAAAAFFAKYAELMLKSHRAYEVTQFYIWYKLRGAASDPCAQKERMSQVVSELLNMSPSAIHIPFVYKFLFRHRQDLLDRYIATDAAICGRFTNGRSGIYRNRTGRVIQARLNRIKIALERNKQPELVLAMRKNIHMLSAEQCNKFATQLSDVFRSKKVTETERVAAAVRWGKLPSVNALDVVQQLKDAEAILPPTVYKRVLLAYMDNDEPLAPLPYLLSASDLRTFDGEVLFNVVERARHVTSTEVWSEVVDALWKERGKLGVSLQKRLIRILGTKAGPSDLERVYKIALHPPTHPNLKVEGICVALQTLEPGKAGNEEFAFEFLERIRTQSGVAAEVLISMLRGVPDRTNTSNHGRSDPNLTFSKLIMRANRQEADDMAYQDSSSYLYTKATKGDPKFRSALSLHNLAQKVKISAPSSHRYLKLVYALLQQPDESHYVKAIALEVILRWVTFDPAACLKAACDVLLAARIPEAGWTEPQHSLMASMLDVAFRVVLCGVKCVPERIGDVVSVVDFYLDKVSSTPFDWRNELYYHRIANLIDLSVLGYKFSDDAEAVSCRLDKAIVNQILNPPLRVATFYPTILKAQFLIQLIREKDLSQELLDTTTGLLREFHLRDSANRHITELAESLSDLSLRALKASGFVPHDYLHLILVEFSRHLNEQAYADVLLCYGQRLICAHSAWELDLSSDTADALYVFLEALYVRQAAQRESSRWFTLGQILSKFFSGVGYSEDRSRHIFGASSLGNVVLRCVDMARREAGMDVVWGGFAAAVSSKTQRIDDFEQVIGLLLALPLASIENALQDLWASDDAERASDSFKMLVQLLAKYTNPAVPNESLNGVVDDKISDVVAKFVYWVGTGVQSSGMATKAGEASWAHPFFEHAFEVETLLVDQQPRSKRHALLETFATYPTLILLLPCLFWELVEQHVAMPADLLGMEDGLTAALVDAVGRISFLPKFTRHDRWGNPTEEAADAGLLSAAEVADLLEARTVYPGASAGMQGFGRLVLKKMLPTLDMTQTEHRKAMEKIGAVVGKMTSEEGRLIYPSLVLRFGPPPSKEPRYY
ncbi:hypothetical protein HDU85_003557 [Gaertneriomyces sp. JEL0708]|nr:hypothetical protein HDU85_003557 [Gaertneriomyces sp. JEL0708]